MAQCPMTSGDATHREYVGLYQVDSATFIFVLYLQKLVCKMKKNIRKAYTTVALLTLLLLLPTSSSFLRRQLANVHHFTCCWNRRHCEAVHGLSI